MEFPMMDAKHKLLALAVSLTAPFALFADEPGPFAPDADKLTYLFETWEGRGLEDLKNVWGRESSVQPRRDNEVYTFEQRKRVRATLLGGIAVRGGGGMACSAYFEIDPDDKIIRGTWRGPSADECWNMFRKLEPL
jgi:hypothetical protein